MYRLSPWHSASDSLQDVLPKRTHRLLPQGRPQLPLLRKALLKQPLPQRQKSIDSLKIAFSPYADADTITTATEPLENLLKETLLEKGYDVKDIDMTVGTSYTAVGEALSAGSADIGFISGGNYVLFSDDCDVLLTALRYAINKDSKIRRTGTTAPSRKTQTK